MQPLMLIHPNPKRRKSGKRRSAAQRAATAKMLAANRNRGGGRKRKYRRSTATKVRSYGRRARRYARKMGSGGGGAILRGFSVGAVTPMLKNAGVGAAGAIGVDVAMGFAARFLPASVISPIDTDGSANYPYYAAKGALAIGLGVLAGKVISPSLASKMAEGSLIVTLHDAAKTFIPAGSVSMGYASSAAIARGGNVRRISEYVTGAVANRGRQREMNGMGEYVRR